MWFCPFCEDYATFGTGKSFSEALILASTNPQYDKRLFIESPCTEHVLAMFCPHSVALDTGQKI